MDGECIKINRLIAGELKNGEIYCKGSETDKSDLRADLITSDMYENYELLVDWKIAAGGNSGIIYNVNEKNDPASYQSGPEYQLIDDEGYPVTNWKTGRKPDPIMPCTQPLQDQQSQSVNTIQLKIVVKGAHREHWLNGVKVVEFEAWSDDWNQAKSNR